MKLYLAPLRGITDAIYRNTFSKHFRGFDLGIAPFITTQQGNRIRRSRLKDILPENNIGMPVIPQILSKDPDAFIILAKAMADLGYDTVNWNLGCPYPMVANKGRGSGMLLFPDKIERFLEKIIPEIPCGLSIKTRVGRNNSEEIFHLAPMFNRYPLTEVIIHARTGIQMFDGVPDLDAFETYLGLSAHPVVYNGDITNLENFRALFHRFKDVNRWMIGRGVLSNPFLPEIIKQDKDSVSDKIGQMKCFHDSLFDEYRQILSGPSHLLDKMKGFWTYFSLGFENGDQIRKKIHKMKKTKHYEAVVSDFFEEARWY